MLKPDELDPSLDAVVAAREFHEVLLENEHVRVLKVVIEPGAKEPFHTHVWQSVFIVFGTPTLRYFIPGAPGHLFEIPSQMETGVLHLAPEGMHSLENVDTRKLFAVRIEMKRAPHVAQVAGIAGPVLQASTRGVHPALDNDIALVSLAHTHHPRFPVLPSVVLRQSNEIMHASWAVASKQLGDVEDGDAIISLRYLNMAQH